MLSEPLKKILIFLMLGLLTASAFFIRLENFNNSTKRSIDEIVYYRMAKQILEEGPSGYNTIPYGREMAASDRPLPDYFFQPLFKHPPLFTLLISFSMKIFGVKLVSAEYIPLLLGVLFIPATYLLGRLLFDFKIAICSALFMWIDPVSIMTSQKVWMDTTLSFLMLMGVLFFVIGLKFDKSSFFIWSGLACGLATLTKYTGIFATVNIGLFAFAYRRELFRNRSFIIGLILPFALLLPWFYANYLVYGGGFLFKQKSLHLNEHLYLVFFILFLSLGILKGLSIYLRRFFVMEDDQQKLEKGVLTRKRIDMVLGITLAIVVFKHIILSLNFNHLPRTSWAGAVLRDSLFTFYVTQLLEYSFVYFFAFASFFIERKERLVEISLLRYGALIVLIFFSIWKYFQCRYILFAIPLLVILAFELIFMIYEKIEKIDGFLPRLFLKSALLFPIIYGLGRTVMIDLLLSFPNDMCYF